MKLSLSLILLIGCIFIKIPGTSAEKLPRGIAFKEGYSESIIPYRKVENLIVIPAKLNGKTLNFILDTGSKNIIVFSKYKPEQISPGKNRSSLSRVTTQFQGQIVYDNKLDLPGIHGNGIPYIIMNVKKNKRLFKDKNIDGIIGYNLFTRFSIEVDNSQKRIILRNPATFKPDASYTTHLMTIQGTNSFINFKFLDDRYKNPYYSENNYLMIDTGAMPSIMLAKEFFRRNSKIGKFISGEPIYGMKNRLNCKYGIIRNVNLLSRFFPELGTILVKETWFHKYPDINRVGTLGMGFLTNYNFIIDYSNRKLYLKPINNFSSL